MLLPDCQYVLSHALLVYERKPTREQVVPEIDGTSLLADVPQVYVERHAIGHDAKGRVYLLTGEPLTVEDARDLAAGLSCARAYGSGLLPPTVLAMNPSGDVLWWSPAALRTLRFTERVALPGGVYHCPAMLFMVRGGVLYAFALDVKARPDARAKLFNAPFWNIHDDGSVCMGTVRIEDGKGSITEIVQGYENAFWNSAFSHPAGEAKRCESGDLVALWSRLHDAGEKFPLDELVPYPLGNLGQLVAVNFA